jgi:hypothetical protein
MGVLHPIGHHSIPATPATGTSALSTPHFSRPDAVDSYSAIISSSSSSSATATGTRSSIASNGMMAAAAYITSHHSAPPPPPPPPPPPAATGYQHQHQMTPSVAAIIAERVVEETASQGHSPQPGAHNNNTNGNNSDVDADVTDADVSVPVTRGNTSDASTTPARGNRMNTKANNSNNNNGNKNSNNSVKGRTARKAHAPYGGKNDGRRKERKRMAAGFNNYLYQSQLTGTQLANEFLQ